MAAVPEALAGYRQSLLEGVRRGRVSAVRQVDKCAAQCDTYSGATSGAPTGFFAGLAAGAGQSGSLGDELARAAAAADAAYAELARFLRVDLRPHAPELDAVGEEVYARGSRDFLGATVDLHETYAWGWQEFLSIEAELEGGGRPDRARRHADARWPTTSTATRATRSPAPTACSAGCRTCPTVRSTSSAAPTSTSPTPLRTLDCKIAPPGGGVGAYYTGPSDDFSRPGAMWWSVEQGKEVFPTWREVTTVYHEGVPGHHLQIATATYQRDSLNDYQRLLAGTSGHAEGWALYAERLVRELGYLDDDGDLLGMLDAQLFRAARVVIDIGMHLQLEIPTGTGFHEGERWTPELGLEFLLTRTISDPAHSADEIDRYLGWPGQAPSYKVGERLWLEGRDAAQGPPRRHVRPRRTSTPRPCSSAAWASTRCSASSPRSDVSTLGDAACGYGRRPWCGTSPRVWGR